MHFSLGLQFSNEAFWQVSGFNNNNNNNFIKSQIILAEHECSTNWGDCKSINQIK